MNRLLGRLLHQSGLMLLATGVLKGASTVLFLLISRRYGAAEAGIYSLSTTYLAIFLGISVWGLDELLIRQVAQNRLAGPQFLLNFGLLRVVVSLLFYGLLFLLVTQLLPYSTHTATVVAVLGASLVPEGISQLCQAVLIAYEQFRLAAGVMTTIGGIRLLAGITIVLLPQSSSHNPLEILARILVFVSLLGAGLNGILALLTLQRYSQLWILRPTLDPQFCIRYLYQTIPLIIMGLCLVIEYQIDGVLLSLWRGEKEVGYYGAAQTVLTALWLIPQAYQAAIYPIMARTYRDNRAQMEKLFDRTLEITGLVGIVMASVVFVSAPILPVIFGPSFHPAIQPMRWLAIPLLFTFLNVSTSRLMLVANHLRPIAWTVLGSMTMNVSLNILLIPTLGMIGAAMARAASSSIFFIATSLYLHRHVYAFDRGIILRLAGVASGIGLLLWIAQMSFQWK